MKGQDSPIKKQPTYKFSPSKSKYLTKQNHENTNAEVLKQNIGDSSGSGGGGFRMHAMGSPTQAAHQEEGEVGGFQLHPIAEP